MKSGFSLRCLFYFISAILIFCSCNNGPQFPETKFQQIKSGFETPSDTNTVWCYWYWINDDISKDGITKDLLAMKEAGIGVALIGNINPAGVDGEVPMLSEDWWSHMVHAVTEGKRIGVDIGIFNCPGWSQSGGPWVDYTKAMRYLTYSETKVQGSKLIKVHLPKPKEEFQDTHTLAFKTADGEKRDLINIPTILNCSKKGFELNNLIDNNLTTAITFPAKKNLELSFNFNLSEAIKARQITINPSQPFSCNCKLYAELNGEEKLVKAFVFDRSNLSVNVGPITKGALALSLPNAESKRFKLVCNNFKSLRSRKYGFAEINISEAPVLDRYIEKQLGKMHPTPTPQWNTYSWEMQGDQVSRELCIDVKELIDISDKLDSNGLLTWEAPVGEWTILRIGMSPTGTKNSPSAPQGQGYEIDKMNGELAQFHFDNFVGEFLKRIPEESKSAFKYVIADSYEMGSQNWTDGYEVKFKEKYGYDPVKYLPVLSGRIVGSVEESERFLWDLRRSIADDVAYEYVGGLRKASKQHNLKTWLENYGHWGFPGEFMMYGGQSDLIGGEFWNEGSLGNIECKASSSTSHTYGKRITSAEAFTASRKSYLRHPAMLKKRGDWSLTEGINHFVLHLYIQQPDDNRKPGMNAWFSTEFNRHNTWFNQADNYFDYLRRCQHLLQQGNYAADVCYFIGEDAPIMTGGRVPEIPHGYSYDYINAEVILDRLTVKEGKFVLPDGMSYSILVLPPVKTMRPEVLAKLEQLIKQGGIILGQKPLKSPSLQDYPQCDVDVKKMADKLWAAPYVEGKMSNSYGKGKVLDGYNLSEVFTALSLKKDFGLPEDVPLLWTHRRMPGMEIYFITNQSDGEIDIKPTFRVDQSLKPQLWDAVSGEVRALNDYKITDEGSIVPIKLKSAQSCFVVFVNTERRSVKEGYATNFPEPELLQTIEQPFSVDFTNKEIGPKEPIVFNTLTDWSLSDNDKIKFYSGSAIYKTTFSIDQLPANGEFYINLGKVSVMAEVKINGKALGGVWISPYRLNVTNALKKGKNDLEIEVVNLWRNQLIKDEKLPDDQRYTWLVIDDVKEGEKPHSSGLLGPVTIETIR
ncbi:MULTISPECIES: glycosyl hydrolase [unclassified Saccharicrinis]|uniref:glycosyl hydrolase n=1 Tax=unclassified Saccharicrinis TaxID=2646859 RepID=UPI003D33EF89